MTMIDRWILDRLDHVIAECRSAYAAFEFHKVYHSINHFCAVDLSSLYIDITKDRMYCDAPDSPRRRATQFAMHKIFDALCRLLAPVLVFTAEEAWGYTVAGVADAGSRSATAATTSVHLQFFPEIGEGVHDASVDQQIEQLLRLRGVIGQALEKARQEKLIGNSLEARVILKCDRKVIGSRLEGRARRIFYSERPHHRRCERGFRHCRENALRKMCALLAPSRECRPKSAPIPICATAAKAWLPQNEAVIPSVSRGIPMRNLKDNVRGSLDFARDDARFGVL